MIRGLGLTSSSLAERGRRHDNRVERMKDQNSSSGKQGEGNQKIRGGEGNKFGMKRE